MQPQRIVSGIVPLDAGEAEAGGRLLKDASINWVVLKDDQRIEELAQAHEALDFGQAQMLVSDQLGLAVLEPGREARSAAQWGAAAPAPAGC